MVSSGRMDGRARWPQFLTHVRDARGNILRKFEATDRIGQLRCAPAHPCDANWTAEIAWLLLSGRRMDVSDGSSFAHAWNIRSREAVRRPPPTVEL
ncbi:hypothetical protein ACLOJK_040730 [Asimina triloba]